MHTKVAIRVQPRAKRTEIDGRRGDAIRVRLTAPPTDGKANSELIALLAERLGVARSAVTIVSGEKSRDKVVAIEGLSADEIRRALPL